MKSVQTLWTLYPLSASYNMLNSKSKSSEGVQKLLK